MAGQKERVKFRREKFQKREEKYFIATYCVGNGRKVPETLSTIKETTYICIKIQQLGNFTNKLCKIQGIFAEKINTWSFLTNKK